jgi:hypothetical protein
MIWLEWLRTRRSEFQFPRAHHFKPSPIYQLRGNFTCHLRCFSTDTTDNWLFWQKFKALSDAARNLFSVHSTPVLFKEDHEWETDFQQRRRFGGNQELAELLVTASQHDKPMTDCAFE